MKNNNLLGILIIIGSVSAACSNSGQENSSKKAVILPPSTEHVKQSSLHSEWSYDGNTGPEYWENLSDYYSNCGCGHAQSPIDVDPKAAEHFDESLNISYSFADIDFINNGHTIKEMVHTKNTITFIGKTYQLIQFHFHTPAEHFLNHKQAPMELHFVHMSKDKDVAVIAVFVDDSTIVNPTFSLISQYVPKHHSEEIVDKYVMDLNQFLPKNKSFYHYSGSLTTPPCSEGVKWIVLSEPITATREQIESIHSIIDDDNRPLQLLEGRPIYTSN